MTEKGCYVHSHKGQEESRYYPDRKQSWTKRENPHGYRCNWCNRVIKWVYKAGVLWQSPRFYCDRHSCQRVREHRADIFEQEHGVGT